MIRAPITTVLALLTGAAIAALPALAAAQEADLTDPAADSVAQEAEGTDDETVAPDDDTCATLEASEDVEIHKTLRWFHLATMLATAVFGVVTANIDTDFQTRQALSLVHQGLGVTTFGLLTAAAAVVVF